AGSWTGARGIELRQLALRAPDGHADLTGNIVVGSTYKGESKASFAGPASGTEYAGELAARGDGKQAHLDLQLTLPMPARLQLDMA
ncbi:hypothetical protein M1731_23195, partial [Salmonella enterica subsp. enterica serovar Javiana]|uniref:hypothetical protein n=1 Tax=Salmonella enterica TaxID=28901 RepID=UPI0021B3C4C3